MEITRMTLSQETKQRLASVYPASKSRRRQIRIEALKQLSNSKENGHEFPSAEIQKAIGYNNDKKGQSATWSFLKSLRSRPGKYGLRVEQGDKYGTYVVYDESAVTVKEQKPIDSVVKAAVTFGQEIEKEKIKQDNSGRCYNIHFIIEKRNGEDYGSTKLVDMSLNKTTLENANKMINEVMKDVE